MATFFNGFSGSVTFNSVTYNVESWKATVAAELLDTTNTGDNSFQTNIAGVKKLTGELKLYIDSAALPFGSTALTPGVSAAASLTLGNTSKSITTTLRLTECDVENAAKGVVTLSVKFESNGSWTLPT